MNVHNCQQFQTPLKDVVTKFRKYGNEIFTTYSFKGRRLEYMRYGYNSNNLYTPTEKHKILLDWGHFLI